MTKTTRKGFTLIELLIVIAIIGILSSVVLVGLGPIQKRGRDARRIADLKQVQTGLELFFGSNGVYPATAGGWANLGVQLATVGVTQIPNDPSAPARIYNYCADLAANGTTYLLAATLEDVGNPVLRNDIDGALLASCSGGAGAPATCGVAGPTDSIYCVRL